MLCVSMRLTSEAVLEEIFEAWFETEYEPNENDEACLTMIDQMDDMKRSG